MEGLLSIGPTPSTLYTFHWSSFPLGFRLIFSFFYSGSFGSFWFLLVSVGTVPRDLVSVVESSSVFLESLLSSLSPVLVGHSSSRMGRSGSFVWN